MADQARRPVLLGAWVRSAQTTDLRAGERPVGVHGFDRAVQRADQGGNGQRVGLIDRHGQVFQ